MISPHPLPELPPPQLVEVDEVEADLRLTRVSVTVRIQTASFQNLHVPESLTNVGARVSKVRHKQSSHRLMFRKILKGLDRSECVCVGAKIILK